MSFVFIPDGYEFSGYIAEEPGIHGALRFTYRPMADSDVTALNAELEKATSRIEQQAARAKAIAERIKAWEVVDPSGKAVKPTAENLGRCPAVLFTKLASVVEGYRPNDKDPTGKTEPKSGQEELLESQKN